MRFARIAGHSLAIAVCFTGIAAVAPAYADEDGKTLTRKLIDAEAQVALQKLEQDLSKGASSAAVVTAPTPAAMKAQIERDKPRTVALYGVDGRAAGGVLSLRSYVRWGGETYAARVGGKWRGYTVSSIGEGGTTLTKGKAKVFVPYEQDDGANLFEHTQENGLANAPRPAGPLPSAAVSPGAMPNGVMPLMPPQSAVPAPSALPIAPVTPVTPAVPMVTPAAAASVALR